ncbi:MAG TPA: response regulator [Candidatus Nanoarchaeia archaeon]|nr:response regulator [Candidatus Nanoarchaeia archaeon]
MSDGIKKVLVVDDEPNIRELAEIALGRRGYDVVTVPSAEEAVRYLSEINGVHVLLTDLRLPGMSGLELIAFMQQNRPEVPIIAMSGHHREEIPGTVGQVNKPFDIHDLVGQVRLAEKYAPFYEHA